MGGTEEGNAADEAAIRRLAESYARAVDGNAPESLAALFTRDAVIEGPGFVMNGLSEISTVPGMLKKMYSRTLHIIHGQTVIVSGDSAEVETSATANHVSSTGNGRGSNLVWAIRYQDSLKRDDGQWRFAHRRLVIDWTETRPVNIDPLSS